jgi:hypothetical protein
MTHNRSFNNGTYTGLSTSPEDHATIAVTFESLEDDELRQLRRAEAYERLKVRNEQLRDALAAWLEENHLREFVSRISEVNVFDMLFIDGPPALAKLLVTMPGVSAVNVVEDDVFEAIEEHPISDD